MIKQVYMSPSKALHHWIVDSMTIEQVLSQTGYTRWSDLSADHIDALESTEFARQDLMMSPEERQREEDVEAVWTEFGDYMREMVPPGEYELEIERLLPLIVATRKIEDAARSKPFRDSVARRNSRQ
jgi:hypothetical protein